MPRDASRYAAAGVDLDAARRAKDLLKGYARATFGPEVLGDIGHFGGLYALSGYQEPVLVSSADGVGTKLKVAIALGRYDTVGQDIVNHCVNDILVLGARPLFFLDYIGAGRLQPEMVAEVVRGASAACSAVGCALIGGETAEMPGLYASGDFDLVGFIVGVVERRAIIDGSSISRGDLLLGLPSSGLHTNGYSLVRRLFALDEHSPKEWDRYHKELGATLGETLLQVHRCYLPAVQPVLPWVKGLAHVTGGGLPGNLPRIIPDGLGARIELGSWKVPPLFRLIQEKGDIPDDEMFRVFNMGIGMVVVCSPDHAPEVEHALPEAIRIGQIVARRREPRVTFVRRGEP
ncbi:MAG: phosphoribosylformylglycinamidine cyclo-ligase [Chloroflexi bacterium]|nr:phosphoribosylformylglycinamidine cyclo-ligase [Chloroflexota bacterium]